MNKLLLCAGADRRDGYTTLDGNPESAPDICQTIPPLPPEVRARQWDVIELIHGIEHFPIWEAHVLLRECYDVLAPGGMLVLEQPNVLFAAKVLCGLEKPLTDLEGQCDMWVFYGDPRYEKTLQLHKWGWTPETLTEELSEIGFSDIAEKPVRFHLRGRDFRLEAVKC